MQVINILDQNYWFSWSVHILESCLTVTYTRLHPIHTEFQYIEETLFLLQHLLKKHWGLKWFLGTASMQLKQK